MGKKRENNRKISPTQMREEKFVTAWLKCFCHTQAAIEAGYSTPHAGKYGFAVFSKPRVQKMLRDRLDKEGITRERIAGRLAELAFPSESGANGVSNSDSLSALEKLAKIQGLNSETLRVEGKITWADMVAGKGTPSAAP